MQDPDEPGHSGQESRCGRLDGALEVLEVVLQCGAEVGARPGGQLPPVPGDPLGGVAQPRIVELGEDRVERVPDAVADQAAGNGGVIVPVTGRAGEGDSPCEHREPAGALGRD